MKKTLVALAIIAASFILYTLYINRNSLSMSPRQKIMKAIYPAIMWLSKTKSTRLSNESAQPPVSFYSLKTTAIDGSPFNFATLTGKKVLLVNTASDCGFTNQYAALETLYQQFGNELVILAFPANDFKDQEKGNDESIAAFCKKNYGVSFPVMRKGSVVKGQEQQPVYQWLTSAKANGWNIKAPSWNFCKYLVNGQGQLTNYFDPGISPLSVEVLEAISK